MKKAGKILSAILVIVLVLATFSACGLSLNSGKTSGSSGSGGGSSGSGGSSGKSSASQIKGDAVSVRYVLNGGSFTDKGTVRRFYKRGDVLTKDTVPEVSYSGKVFVGWYRDYSCRDRITYPYTLNENISLYALYGEEGYVVNFNSNGGEPVEPIKGLSEIIDLPWPIRDGYRFIGWSGWAIEDKSARTYSNLTVPKEGYTLYANWERLSVEGTYTVTYNTMGGSAIESKELFYLSEGNLPKPPTKKGYIFKGWTFYEGGPIITDNHSLPFVLQEDKTLYAKWKVIAPTDKASKETLRGQFEKFTFDVLVGFCGYYGLGVDSGYTYHSFTYNGKTLKPYNMPTSTSDEYLETTVVQEGTCFDAIRGALVYTLSDKSLEKRKEGARPIHSNFTVDLPQLKPHWWDYEDVSELLQYKKEYTDNFLDRNFKLCEYFILNGLTDRGPAKYDDDGNYVTYGVFSEATLDAKIEELLEEYLYTYSHLGFKTEKEDSQENWAIMELFSSLRRTSYNWVNNYFIKNYIDALIDGDDAPYRVVEFNK